MKKNIFCSPLKDLLIFASRRYVCLSECLPALRLHLEKTQLTVSSESLVTDFFQPWATPRTVAFEISKLLDCGLDKESLALLIALCENGVNPESLAVVIRELHREASALTFRKDLVD